MVSVGVQNEMRLYADAGALPPCKKKPKTRTIILMDAAVQTGDRENFKNEQSKNHP